MIPTLHHLLPVKEKHAPFDQSVLFFFFSRSLQDCSVSWLKKWAPGLLECTCWGRWATSSSGQQWWERSGWSSTRLDAVCVSSPGPHLTVKEQGCEDLEHWSLFNAYSASKVNIKVGFDSPRVKRVANTHSKSSAFTLDIFVLASPVRKPKLLISFCTTKFCSSRLKFCSHRIRKWIHKTISQPDCKEYWAALRLTWDLHHRMKISATILKSSVESASGSLSHLDLEQHMKRSDLWHKAQVEWRKRLRWSVCLLICTCCCPHSGWAWGSRRRGPCKGQQTHPGWAAQLPGYHLCCRPSAAPLQQRPSFTT